MQLYKGAIEDLRFCIENGDGNCLFCGHTNSEQARVIDAFLSGRVKKSKAALFTTIIQAKAQENNINLDIIKRENHKK